MQPAYSFLGTPLSDIVRTVLEFIWGMSAKSTSDYKEVVMTKAVWAIVASALILSSSAVTAQNVVKMDRLTCSELPKLYMDEYVVIAAWMSGYYNAKSSNTTIDVKLLASNSKKVDEFCKSNPKMTVMNAIKQLSRSRN